MSSFIPSTLAASLSQGVYQQTQSARTQDSERGEATRNAQKMRELLAKHINAVEDSYESTDDHVTVNEDGQGSSQAGYYDSLPKKPRADAGPETADEAAGDAPPTPSTGGLDLTA